MNGDAAPRIYKPKGRLWLLLLALGGALAVLCHQGFLPHRVFWANDVPLGAMMDPSDHLPGTFAGHWTTLYYIGGPTPSSSPAFSTLLQWVFPPTTYLKIFVPLVMFFLGFGAWFFFRQLGFAPGVCIIGGIGAGLNMHYFSNACWGLGTWAISAAMVFISLAAIMSAIRPVWIKAALAGLAVGMVVMEGFDIGAILSLYVGIYIIFYFLTQKPDPAKAMPQSIGMGVVTVIFALLISCSTLYTLVGTQIKGIASAGQSPEEKEARWDFNTQWSFPKMETLRLIIPGLYGYRLQDYITDTNRASAYWGSIGEDPRLEGLESSNPDTRRQTAASLGMTSELQNAMAGNDASAHEQILDQVERQVQLRHTGSGDYTGVLVCLLAVFGLFNSWRKLNPVYSRNERQQVWFWTVAALFSMWASWGRHGQLFQLIPPVYKLIYHLPFLGNIRNPIKFLHPLNICLIILSGYGLEALHRRYLSSAVQRAAAPTQQLALWWKKAAGFDKKWTIGTLLAVGASILAWLVLSSSSGDLTHHLEHNGFWPDAQPGLAAKIAAFCIQEVALFVIFFAASTGVLILCLSGVWSGARATWAWVFLGAIMVVDLSRADAPWVRYYDWTQKYSMNPIVDYLRHEPWEHRVMSRMSPTGGYIPGEGNFVALCHWWLENDYLANNIESLEIDQAPRLPDMDRDYIGNFMLRSQQDLSPMVRMWRLTNTRYIFADARITAALNNMAEPRDSFRDVMRVDIVPKPGVSTIEDAGDLTVVSNNNGHLALIEFIKALPRAKLYANWQALDDQKTLQTLNTPEFDPEKTVLLATNTPVTQSPGNPNADPGTVKITSYEPRDVELSADAKTPSVLLLNDRTGDYWRVWVDGKESPILRCNYIMRGVFVPPGQHEIEFRFRAPMRWLYVSIAGFAIGILLTGFVVVTHYKRAPTEKRPTA